MTGAADGSDTDRPIASVLVVGSGPQADRLARALASTGQPTHRAATAPGPGASVLSGLALVVEASPDGDARTRAEGVRALLDGVPDGVPVAIATRCHLVGALLPPPGRGSHHVSRAVGIHLMDGAPPQDLVGMAEVVLPVRLDADVADEVLALLEGRGIPAVPVADAPGRVVDRLTAAVWLEARAAIVGGTPPADLEAAVARAGVRLDPLPDADAAGIVRAMGADLGDPDRFAAPGDGRGRPLEGLAVRLALAAIAEAYRLVEEGVGGADQIERAMTLGAGWPAGPFTLAGRRGLRDVVAALAAIGRDPAEDAAARDRFAIPRLLWVMATA